MYDIKSESFPQVSCLINSNGLFQLPLNIYISVLGTVVLLTFTFRITIQKLIFFLINKTLHCQMSYLKSMKHKKFAGHISQTSFKFLLVLSEIECSQSTNYEETLNKIHRLAQSHSIFPNVKTCSKIMMMLTVYKGVQCRKH